MFQVRVWQADLTGQLGLALSHPLYIVLAKGFSWLVPGDFAWRVNLFSAVCSAGAIGFIFAGLRRLTNAIWPALLAVLLLTLSHTFWTHAVIAEVYGLYALLLALEFYLLLRYHQSDIPANHCWLIGLFLVNGLSLSNHLLALLHLPAYGIYALLQLRAKRVLFRHLLLMALAWIIGSGLYEAMIVIQIARGGNFADTIRSALFGLHWQNRVIGQMPDLATLAKSLGYFLLNFPTPLLLLSPLGIYFAFRDKQTKPVAAVWFAICSLAFIFALRYRVPDQYVFFFPCYVFTAIFIGVAIARFISGHTLASLPAKVAIVILALLPALIYEVAPGAIRQTPFLTRIADKALRAQRAIPGRDIYRYFLRPRKNADNSAFEFSLAALQLAQPEDLIIADNTTRNPIIYLQQVEDYYPSVHLSPGDDLQASREAPADLATIDRWLAAGRRVFIISRIRQRSLVEQLETEGRFSLRANDLLYEIERIAEPIE